MTWTAINSQYWAACDAREDRPLPVDPYFVWAEATGFSMLFQYRQNKDSAQSAERSDRDGIEHLRLLVQLLDGRTAQHLADAAKGWGAVAPIWLDALPGIPGSAYDFCVLKVYGWRSFLSALKSTLGDVVERFVLCNPIAEQSADYKAWDPPQGPLYDHIETLIGVIDDGCAFAHRDFGTAGGGTRIRAIWDQDAQRPAFQDWLLATRHAGQGEQPELSELTGRFPYGATIWHPALNALIKQFTTAGSVDEQACYLAANYQSALRGVSHGMHVLSLAAGPVAAGARIQAATGPMLAPRTNSTPQHPVVFVQIARSAAADASGAWLGAALLDGLRFILQQARTNTRHVIANISYGPQCGPLDGSSPIEEAFARLVKQYEDHARMKLQIVLPAGNGYLARGRAKLTIDAGKIGELQWQVLPDNHCPSAIEIWVSKDGADGVVDPRNLQVQVIAPGLPPSGWIRCGSGMATAPAGHEGAACAVVFAGSVARGRHGPMILIAVGPTTGSGAGICMPAGRWRIQVCNQNAAGSIQADAFVGRGDSNFGTRRRPRQSYLVDRNYDPDRHARAGDTDTAASVVTRAGTLSGIASGKAVTVVGGYRASDGEPASYTAAGPVRGGPGAGVNMSAISDQSVALHGILGAGNRSAGVARFVGTSAAAPQATRWFAQNMTASKLNPTPEQRRSSDRLSSNRIPKDSC